MAKESIHGFARFFDPEAVASLAVVLGGLESDTAMAEIATQRYRRLWVYRKVKY